MSTKVDWVREFEEWARGMMIICLPVIEHFRVGFSIIFESVQNCCIVVAIWLVSLLAQLLLLSLIMKWHRRYFFLLAVNFFDFLHLSLIWEVSEWASERENFTLYRCLINGFFFRKTSVFLFNNLTLFFLWLFVLTFVRFNASFFLCLLFITFQCEIENQFNTHLV